MADAVPARKPGQPGDRLKVVLSGLLGPLFGGVAADVIPIRSDIAQAIGLVVAGLVAIEISLLLQRRGSASTRAGEPARWRDPSLWVLGTGLFLLWLWLSANPPEPLLIRILVGFFVFAATFFTWIFVTSFSAPVPHLTVLGLGAAVVFGMMNGGFPAVRLHLPLVLLGGFGAGLVGFGYVQAFRKVTVTVRLRLPAGAAAPQRVMGDLAITWVAQHEANSQGIAQVGLAGAFGSDGTMTTSVTCSLNDLAPELNYRITAVVQDAATGGIVFGSPPDVGVWHGDEMIGREIEVPLVARVPATG